MMKPKFKIGEIVRGKSNNAVTMEKQNQVFIGKIKLIWIDEDRIYYGLDGASDVFAEHRLTKYEETDRWRYNYEKKKCIKRDVENNLPDGYELEIEHGKITYFIVSKKECNKYASAMFGISFEGEMPKYATEEWVKKQVVKLVSVIDKHLEK